VISEMMNLKVLPTLQFDGPHACEWEKLSLQAWEGDIQTLEQVLVFHQLECVIQNHFLSGCSSKTQLIHPSKIC
jgi:hypothetical protein